MAEDTVSRRQEHARVPRDHLPKPVHPGAGRAETRADGAPAEQTAHAPLGIYGGHQCESVLLRPAESVAARHQRKHQSSIETILPPRNRPDTNLTSAARPGRAALESTSQKDLGLPDSGE